MLVNVLAESDRFTAVINTVYILMVRSQLGLPHSPCCYLLIPKLSFLPSDVPLVSTLVSAPYSGCMEVSVNGQQVDLDQAIHKHNDIRSHSCPLLDSLQ